MARVWRNNMTLGQIWPLVTSGELNIDLSEKNDWNTFKSTHEGQSNAFSRAFLSFFVYELGGVVILTPPPLPHHHGEGGWEPETATGARVKIAMFSNRDKARSGPLCG